nr:hypothetical protein [Tanacetum cinerariifolium]
MARQPLGWKVVKHVSHKKFLNGGVIVVEDDPDVIHVDNSYDLSLSTSLNDLEIAALHIDRFQQMLHRVIAVTVAPKIYAGIKKHLQKIYNGKKVALKERYWVPDEDGTYDVERIKRERPSHILRWRVQLLESTRSLIHTFFLTHTIGDVFLNPEDKALYLEYGGGSGSGGCEDNKSTDDEDGGEDGEDEDNS